MSTRHTSPDSTPPTNPANYSPCPTPPGEEQARATVFTASDPVRLVAISDRDTIRADDPDLAFITSRCETTKAISPHTATGSSICRSVERVCWSPRHWTSTNGGAAVHHLRRLRGGDQT